ncbi:MAG: efflux RND transporter permease subunit [Gammaproteobacteria bacterium]|nr:efflux RND transporter permease subunit [Gammaproteobacteria bacterium]
MNRIIAWFAENSVAANLIMLLIIFGGILSLPSMRKEIVPDVSLEMIVITIPYPGASPTDVERAVLTRVEAAIFDLEGLKSIQSTASENRATVRAKVAYGYDIKELLGSVKVRVEGIESFPKDVGKPLIQEIAIRNLVSKMIIAGPADERSLKTLAKKIREDLLEKEEISQVEISDVRADEISIELSESSMQRYGLSFAEVVHVIQTSSLNSSGGQLHSQSGKVSLGIQGKAQSGADYEEIVLRSDSDGGRIFLKDVATVLDGIQKSSTQSHFNGQPAVSLKIFRVGKQNILTISDTLEVYINNPETYLPDGISLHIWNDSSKYFRSRINLLVNNAISGFCLLFAILLLFLRFKLSFWTSMGIPTAFFGAFWVLPLFDGSINMISMFAFILVLGIVVDDAVIVGENIFSHNRRGIIGLEGAIKGAQDVAKPVVYAIITTMVAFAPLIFLPGPEGKLIRIIPIVVICTLAFSLIESLLILPAHLSGTTQLKRTSNGRLRFLERIQSSFSEGLEHFIQHRFRPFLETVLRWRYSAIMVFIALFIIAAALLGGGWAKVRFFSEIEGDLAIAKIRFARSTQAHVTEDAVKRVENAAKLVGEALLEQTGERQVHNILASAGKGGDYKGTVVIELAPSETRSIPGETVSQLWREKIGSIPDIVSLDISHTLNSPGPSIDIQLYSQDLSTLRAASDDLKKLLTDFSGVYEIHDSFQRGKQEVNLTMKPAGRDLGLNLSELAKQVRQAFHGTVVQTVQRGEDEVKVIVRLPGKERNSLWHLENMHIRLQDKSTTPLLTVAKVNYGSGPAEIKRSDRKRIIRVQARVDESLNNEGAIMNALKRDFLNDIKQNYPGVRWGLAGMQKNKKEAIDYLITSFSLAIAIMYMLMASLFRSYTQPLMVMFAIPFGLIGALGGHLLLGVEISIWSLVGMVAVSGVVVNDTLVLVDYINRNRLAGVPLDIAIREAGTARFRPIMLTSLTTFAGLTPLMLEQSLQAQFMVPMAISLAFGVMFATIVSLVLVPSVYFILDDIKALLGMKGISHFVNAQEAVSSKESLALALEPAPAVGSKTLKWHIGLDDAYADGYKAGLSGKSIRNCPYDDDALQASWEAGWNDGNDQSKA